MLCISSSFQVLVHPKGGQNTIFSVLALLHVFAIFSRKERKMPDKNCCYVFRSAFVNVVNLFDSAMII